MQVNNAIVVQDELSKVAPVKSIENDGEVWHVQFENTMMIDFENTRFETVKGVNIKQMWTKTDTQPHDTLAVNLTFNL